MKRSLLLLVALFALVSVASSCGRPSCQDDPVGPGCVPSPQPPPPPPAGSASLGHTFENKTATTTATQSGSAAATIALSKTTVTQVLYQDGFGQWHYVYTPRFVLTETSGMSGASFSMMQLVLPSGERWDSCFDAQVNAGTTFDPFSVEENCYTSDVGTPPDVRSDTRASSVTVTLTFVDDKGVSGTLTARLDIGS